jgi:hypothetical protein
VPTNSNFTRNPARSRRFVHLDSRLFTARWDRGLLHHDVAVMQDSGLCKR